MLVGNNTSLFRCYQPTCIWMLSKLFWNSVIVYLQILQYNTDSVLWCRCMGKTEQCSMRNVWERFTIQRYHTVKQQRSQCSRDFSAHRLKCTACTTSSFPRWWGKHCPASLPLTCALPAGDCATVPLLCWDMSKLDS